MMHRHHSCHSLQDIQPVDPGSDLGAQSIEVESLPDIKKRTFVMAALSGIKNKMVYGSTLR